MDDSQDNSVRDFIIEQTGGDHTVDIYDQWCQVSNVLEYDHVSANAFIMSALEHSEPGVIVNRIMSGFAVAAHAQAANAGIVLRSDLTYAQLLMWVNTMHQISNLEDYTEVKEMLYSDMPDKDKLQKVFEIIGPGQDPKYEHMLLSVEPSTIDGFKDIIEQIQSDPAVKADKQKDIQDKIKAYMALKQKTQGSLFSDKYASMPSCYNMDIDKYITPMKDSMDFYTAQDNWNEFFIDIWGCLILSNADKEQYKELMTAAVYEFFDNETIRPKVIVEMNKAIARLA